MECYKLVIFFLALGAWVFAVEGRVIDSDGPGHDAIFLEQRNKDTKCIRNSVTKPNCANTTADQYLIPHPDDCHLYYYCVGDLPVCMECPDGLQFNPSKHVCDYSEDAGCDRPIPALEAP
ncbi:unnamed protein product [Parnassius apollo]|uniref:(apollo) hypothetical protein n=1 Tax=Parnassius apollo TaxID=110799 RepID=A0A8S3XNZ1_PARAO|nr:unnamed protein product [Parnassius apollo]